MPSRNDLEIRTNLGGVLDQLKDADATLKREIRRSIRRSGDAVISEAGRILDSENPGAITAKVAQGRRIKRIDAAGATGRSRRNMRAAVKKGLASRVTNGKRGANFRVVSAAWNPEVPAGALNRKILRHPVFGNRSVWAGQKGLQYFSRGIKVGGKQATKDLIDALRSAQERLESTPPVK